MQIAFIIALQELKYHFPEKPVNMFFDYRNPLFFILFFATLLIIVTYFITVKVIIPQQNKHKEELANKEKDRLKLMALFSELNPDPLIRFNSEGKIIHYNNVAAEIFAYTPLSLTPVQEILPATADINLEKVITQSANVHTEITIDKKHYRLSFIGFQAFGFGQLYFNEITEQKELNLQLTQLNTRLIDLTQQLNMLSEKEREKIAKDLHDGIGQYLSLIKLKLRSILPTTEENNPTLNELIQHVDTVIKEIKEIALGLKPRMLNQFGLDMAIKQMVEEVTRHFNIEGTYASYDLQKRFDYNFELSAYRIIQELINNIAKHSGASTFTVEIFQKSDGLTIMVQDNGKGYDTSIIEQGKTGVGLLNLSERIKFYRGKISIDSSPEYGTEVIIEFPEEVLKHGTDKVISS